MRIPPSPAFLWLLTVPILLGLFGRLAAAPGEMDPTFGNNGIVKLDLLPDAVPGIGNLQFTDAVVRPDGKVWVAGGPYLVRLLADGGRDTGFGRNGLLSLPLFAEALWRRADGRLLIAGALNRHFALMGLLEDGSPDPDFAGGQVRLDPLSAASDSPTDILVQPDGRIVVCGMGISGGPNIHVIVRYLPTGARDPDFGAGGVVWIPFSGGGSAQAMALQPDGKLLIAGAGDSHLVLTRLNPDGSPDEGFGSYGKAFYGSGGGAFGLQLEEDGHILVAGRTRGYVPTLVYATLWRYRPDGQLDPQFGTGGLSRLILPNTETRLEDVARLADGKILAAASIGGQSGLVRFLPGGGLDSSFGMGGYVTSGIAETPVAFDFQADERVIVTGYGPSAGRIQGMVRRFGTDGAPTPFGTSGATRAVISAPGSHDRAAAVATTGDGKILVAGSSWSGTTNAGKRDEDFAVVRLRADGGLDPDFGGAGLRTVSVATGDSIDGALCVAVQADGKVLLGGFAEDKNVRKGALVRLRANGTLDTAFGSGTGKLVTTTSEVTHLAIQADGAILTGSATTSAIVLSRHLADGRVDTTFGQSGSVSFSEPDFTYLGGVLVQPDGKILVAGWASGGSRVRRLLKSGAPDLTFGTDGSVRTGPQIAHFRAMALQRDGRIVVAGTGRVEWVDRLLLARYTADGLPDPGFGDEGSVLTSWPNSQASSVVIQDDGKIVVSGHVTENGTKRTAVARFLADGRPDAAFAAAGYRTTGFVAQTFRALALRPNGGIIAVAEEPTFNYSDFGIAAFQAGSRIALSSSTQPEIPPAGTADFGVVTVGRSGRFDLQVRNDGSSPLALGALEVSGAGFAAADPPADPVPVGGVITLPLHFTPGNTGIAAGRLRLTSDADNQPVVEIALTATGNFAPVFPGYFMSAPFESPVSLAAAKLIARAADPEGDAVRVLTAGPASQMLGTAAVEGGGVLYRPPAGFSGVDSFIVTLADARGAEIQGLVTVTVGPAPAAGGPTVNPPQLTPLPGGGMAIRFHGIPGRSYGIQRSTDMTVWETIANATADAAGQLGFTDPAPPRPAAFYRLALP